MTRAIAKSRDEIIRYFNEEADAAVIDICQTTGIVGLSCLVIYEGKPVWRRNLGLRDLDDGEPVTSDTIFPIGALSQSFTAACVTQAMKRRGWSYDQEVKECFWPFNDAKSRWKAECRIWRCDCTSDASIGDLLGHCSGLQAPDHLLERMHAHTSMPYPSDVFSVFRALKPRASPKSQFLYNSVGYAVLSQAVSRDYGKYLQDNILNPLGMSRTVLYSFEMRENQSSLYAVKENGQPVRDTRRVDEPRITPWVAVGGMHSTANDLAKYCNALNKTWKYPEAPVLDVRGDVSRVVFPKMDLLFDRLHPLGDTAHDEKAKKGHAAGWATCTLPAAIGDLGNNPELIDMPTLGSGSLPVKVVWNQSRYHGTNCFVAMLPEYEAAVIVLSNTTTASDATDWIGQFLIQTLLDNPKKNNYPCLASVSALNARQKYAELAEKIEQGRQTGGPKRSLSDYSGEFLSADGHRIMVRKRLGLFGESRLLMSVKGEDNSLWYPLRHHHDDTFTWFMPWDERVRLQQRLNYNPRFYMIEFRTEHGDEIVSLAWFNDPADPEGKVYRHRKESLYQRFLAVAI